LAAFERLKRRYEPSLDDVVCGAHKRSLVVSQRMERVGESEAKCAIQTVLRRKRGKISVSMGKHVSMPRLAEMPERCVETLEETFDLRGDPCYQTIGYNKKQY
jgi:hypothetical protein